MFAPQRIDNVSSASTDELEGRIVSLCRQVARHQAQLLVAVGEFDRREGWKAAGARSCSRWLAWATDLSQTAAREHVRVARALRDLPRLTEAFLRGELTFSKVRALTRVADDVDEALLLRWGHGRTTAEIELIVRDHRIARCSVDPAARRKNRSLTWRYADDGTLLINARLEPEEGAAVLNAIEVALRAARKEPASCASAEAPVDEQAAPPLPVTEAASRYDEDDLDGSPPWERERADALCRVAEGYLSGSGASRSGPDRTLIVLHTNPTALAGEKGTATIEGGPPIDISTARRAVMRREHRRDPRYNRWRHLRRASKSRRSARRASPPARPRPALSISFVRHVERRRRAPHHPLVQRRADGPRKPSVAMSPPPSSRSRRELPGRGHPAGRVRLSPARRSGDRETSSDQQVTLIRARLCVDVRS